VLAYEVFCKEFDRQNACVDLADPTQQNAAQDLRIVLAIDFGPKRVRNFVRVTQGLHAIEVFHDPTLAFLAPPVPRHIRHLTPKDNPL
jgi:hypothetical protein